MIVQGKAKDRGSKKPERASESETQGKAVTKAVRTAVKIISAEPPPAPPPRSRNTPSRRRDCHFAGAPSPSLLKNIQQEEEGAAERQRRRRLMHRPNPNPTVPRPAEQGRQQQVSAHAPRQSDDQPCLIHLLHAISLVAQTHLSRAASKRCFPEHEPRPAVSTDSASLLPTPPYLQTARDTATSRHSAS